MSVSDTSLPYSGYNRIYIPHTLRTVPVIRNLAGLGNDWTVHRSVFTSEVVREIEHYVERPEFAHLFQNGHCQASGNFMNNIRTARMDNCIEEMSRSIVQIKRALDQIEERTITMETFERKAYNRGERFQRRNQSLALVPNYRGVFPPTDTVVITSRTDLDSLSIEELHTFYRFYFEKDFRFSPRRNGESRHAYDERITNDRVAMSDAIYEFISTPCW